MTGINTEWAVQQLDKFVEQAVMHLAALGVLARWMGESVVERAGDMS